MKYLASRVAEAVSRLRIDLRSKVVLTEAASGPYVVTPVIAALAGATVYAFTRSTPYGTVEEIVAQTRLLQDEFPDELDIRLIDELEPEIVAAADVITNSGHLRPLDEAKLKHARSSVVVPLMYEAWEWRGADLDLGYAVSAGIRVGATNERHPDVDVFGYLGEMAVKQVHDAGLSVYRNRFVLICNNQFGPFIAKTLAATSDGVLVIDLDEHQDDYAGLEVDWAGGFPAISIPKQYRGSAAVILAAYPFDQTWFGGAGAELSAASLQSQLDHPLVLRYVGDVDCPVLGEHGIEYFPASVRSGHMGVLPSAIGPDSVIRLQSAGLKVAELMMNNITDFGGARLVEGVR